MFEEMSSKSVGKSAIQRRYADLVQRIFDEDNRIRFAAVYAGQHLLAGGMRPGLPSYDPEEAASELDLEFVRIARAAMVSEQWLGKLGAVLMTYEKVNLALLSFEDTDKFLVVSGEPGFDLLSLSPKLLAFASQEESDS